jgi:hypothetical protein
MTDENTVIGIIHQMHQDHMRSVDALMKTIRNAVLTTTAELCDEIGRFGGDARRCAASIRDVQFRLNTVDLTNKMTAAAVQQSESAQPVDRTNVIAANFRSAPHEV